MCWIDGGSDFAQGDKVGDRKDTAQRWREEKQTEAAAEATARLRPFAGTRLPRSRFEFGLHID